MSLARMFSQELPNGWRIHVACGCGWQKEEDFKTHDEAMLAQPRLSKEADGHCNVKALHPSQVKP